MYFIRLVTADSYQAAPIADVDPTFSQFRGSEIKQVPIVRIFGITDEGEKACLHVHGVFPYLYVPYTGQIEAHVFMYRLAASLDAAINVSLGAAKSNTQHVYKIQEVSAIPLYGYYRKGHVFLRIYFYNPGMHKRAIDLLQSGCVLDQSFQPYEAHIPFILQFMIDYNVYGMSMMKVRNVKHRHESSCTLDQIVHLHEKQYLPFSVTRQSVCKLEVDIWASDILNREVIDKGIDLNPGIAAIWEEEKTRRAEAGLGGDSQLTYPDSPARSQTVQFITDNDIYYQRRFLQRLASLESQANETCSTPSSDNSSYPIPVPQDSHLLNASQLEIHVGPPDTSVAQRFINKQNLGDHESLSLPSQFGNASLDTSDLDLVNILANLAENQEKMDSDSILGSLVSRQDDPLERDDGQEEEEVAHLNLTNLELDNLNFSSWEMSQYNPEKSQHQSQKRTGSQEMELVLESLNNPGPSSTMNHIPQLDGPVDDENARSAASDDPDITIARQEFLECDYRRSRGGRRSVPVTPQKRKRVSSSEDRDYPSPKGKKIKSQLPRTPRRSPNKRTSKLTSPSCPNRTYSPLNLEMSGGQKTPKSSETPVASPASTSRPDRQKLRESFRRRRTCSPVEESNAEGEHVPVESENTKRSLTNAKELFTPEELAVQVSDSDDTLVEDSDESDGTLTSSPPLEPMIIDDSDSNPSYSQEVLQETAQNKVAHDVHSSFFAQINSGAAMKFRLSPYRQQVSEKAKDPEQINELVEQSYSQIPGAGEEQLNAHGLITRQQVLSSMNNEIKEGQPDERVQLSSSNKCENLEPFFSNPEDAVRLPTRGQTTRSLKNSRLEWQRFHMGQPRDEHDAIMLTPVMRPPSTESVIARWKEEKKSKRARREEEEKMEKSEVPSMKSAIADESLSTAKSFFFSDASKHLGTSCGEIEGPSRASMVPADGDIGARALASHQFLTIFCLEVHAVTRPGLLPDPKLDPIAALFYATYNDVPSDWSKVKRLDCGVIIVDPSKVNCKHFNLNGSTKPDEQTLSYVATEEASFEKLLDIIASCDPEMLIGWDIEVQSWGYLFQRASILGKNLSGKVSRIPTTKCTWEEERGGEPAIETLAQVRLPGRIVLEVWRIMKYEIAAYSYTYENVMYNVMNERIARASFDTLTEWWQSPISQWRVIEHYANKVVGIHRLLHHFDIINRTSEHARLYGVQFLEVFSRGSQFRVESMMLRIAKPLNYIPCSPSPQQRASMRAPESLPLIMEPESTMYADPVIVLDFQSLYPSIIIAYNYCFSTCLGRVEHIGAPCPFEFGCTTLKVPKSLALKLQDDVNFAPCGVAFVKQQVRQGILPRMLTEILNTRFMVKKAMKDHPKDDRALQRALHSRQLGLKLIANVTYGYTAANFSGRMPCIEVGDSVVSKGKETLERAIKMVESSRKWGARVIYGDTDSLFVLLRGKSREEAFKIGAEIADAVTATNPKPVKLKFEKVLQPCILQTKKRYCGYMYENLNDEPVYLAKGIETVRRDGCPAVAKILEKSLKILFETKDLSKVKQYVTRQLDKVLSGRASIQDLTFAKEFRGLRGYKAAACVPALELTKRMIQKDPRAVPRTGSRVPYVIVAGGPNEPLIRCVKSPMEVLMDPSLRPNATYYITKVIIPPLNRCLNLIGVDAYAWFMTMPHRQAAQRVQGAMLANANRKQKTTISQYLYNSSCPCCAQACDRGICNKCIKNKTATLIDLHEKCRQYERIYSSIKMICESCIGVKDADSCISLDCPMFYRRIHARRDNAQVSHLYDVINCMEHLT